MKIRAQITHRKTIIRPPQTGLGPNVSLAAVTPTSTPVTNVDVALRTNPRYYTVGGSVTGISGTIVLQNNGGDEVSIQPSQASEFTFKTAIANDATYDVIIARAPAGQICYLSPNHIGTMQGAPVRSIQVMCHNTQYLSWNPYTQTHTTAGKGSEASRVQPIHRYLVGGTISGLSGTLTLQTNGADDTSFNGNGAFSFPATLADGDTYTISVLTQPEGQICTPSSATGSVRGEAVTSVIIACLTIPTIEFRAINKTYGDAAFSLAATSASDGALQYESSNPSVATISGTTVTIIGGGTSTLTVTQAASAGYTSGASSTLLTVAKLRADITFEDFGVTFQDVPVAPPSTSTCAGAITYTSSNESVAVGGSTLTILGAGTSSIRLIQAATATCESDPVSAVLTVSAVCAASLCSNYGTCSLVGGGVYSCSCVAGVTGSRCNIGIDSCAMAPCGLHGSCMRTSTLGGISPPLNSHVCICEEGYSGDSCSIESHTTITFNNIIAYFSGAPFDLLLSPTSTSPGTFAFLSSNPAVATISGNTCSVQGVGTSTITANQSASGGYASSSTAATLTVYYNACVSEPCEHGGVCSPVLTGYSCACAEPYSGAICELDGLNCAEGSEGSCLNGGVCTPTAAHGECACPTCYGGARCDEYSSECA